MSATVPAIQQTVVDLINEYASKHDAVDEAIATFKRAFDALGMAATVQGTFIEPVGQPSYLYADRLRANLLKSGWKAVYNRLQIDSIASAKDKQLFERTMAAPPPLTIENARATFGDYFTRPRFHILRGLAEAFVDLDPAYKSHSKVRIGVKGLPKRIILVGWGEYNRAWASDRFRDVVNALATYQGRPHLSWPERMAISAAVKTGDAVLDGKSVTWDDPDAKKESREVEQIGVDRGITVRGFGNGNAHILFNKWTLLDINRALAEFYGEVLPDAEEEGIKPSTSTAVSKDLQFYWSPPAVIDAALEFAGIHKPEYYRRGEVPHHMVLEPSCGDGRIMDELRARKCLSLGVEYHPGRADQARAKGHAVVTANFLDQPATPDFDRVVMNPPFYGKHYAKHVRHARGFLKPGGTLVAILPATARYDHDELQGDWSDLPVASFADAGTNVPTCLYRASRPS
ncbi:DUF4942 domain-containing protein [soil metagenome]